MGTPITEFGDGSCIPLLETCDWCRETVYKETSMCQNNHVLCAACQDIFCPICLDQMRKEVPEDYTIITTQDKFHVRGSFFTLELEFIAGYLYNFVVVASVRNCRLLCKWATEHFYVVLYKNRKPYSVLPSSIYRTPSRTLHVTVVPQSKFAPKLATTLCAWRFCVEMYPLCLDRPEVATLSLLPDTLSDFLVQYLSSPQQTYTVWKLQHPFPKYGTFFFQSTPSQLRCMQCGTFYETPEGLIACLGKGLVSVQMIRSAVRVTIELTNRVPKMYIDEQCTFENSWSTSGPINKELAVTIPVPTIFSSICHIELDQKKDIVLQGRFSIFVDKLFNISRPRRFKKIVCYDIETDETGIVLKAKIWLCVPYTTNAFTANLISCEHLNKFDSLLFLGLHKSVWINGAALPCSSKVWRNITTLFLP